MIDNHWKETCRQFVGKVEIVTDDLPLHPATAMLATLNEDGIIEKGKELPHLFHWLYFHTPARTEDLKNDGHQKLGVFLPPVPYPRRMWAGSRIDFHHALKAGVPAERRSEIRKVEFKTGSTGPLCFVSVEHVYRQEGQTCLTDLQTIVYREPAPTPQTFGLAPAKGESHQSLGPIVLFRYSALTFNSHRIHYDRSYATKEEGYAGLVVHGPLIATLLLRQGLKDNPGKQPATFSFRGMAPLIDGEGFLIRSEPKDQGLGLTLIKSNDIPASSAEIRWK